MSTPMERVLARLDNKERVGMSKNEWKATCPSHDDRDPSLSVTLAKDKILLHCHAGCTFEDILYDLDLCAADLFLTRNGRIIKQIYDYADAEGYLVHQTVRLHPKKFVQRRPDPLDPDKYIWDLKGIEPILYNLSRVLDAGDEWVFICEGEKSADAVTRLRLVATCNPMGAGKWKDGYTKALAGKNVCILPDDDLAGIDHAFRVGNTLLDEAADVRIVPLYEEGSKKDPWDWVDEGGTRDELLELVGGEETYERTEVGGESSIGGISDWKPRTLQDAYKERPEREYWVDGIFADTSLNIVYGRSGSKKSLLMLDCALAVAGGQDWLPPEPGSSNDTAVKRLGRSIELLKGGVTAKPTKQVPVMWLDFDDGMHITEERAEAIARCKYGTDNDIPFYYDSFPTPTVRANDDDLMADLVDFLLDRNIKMLVVGNLGTTSGGARENTAEMIRVMTNWRWVAETAGTTVVVIAHPRKGEGQGQEMLRGHSSIMAAVDLALHVDDDGQMLTIQSTKERGAPVGHFGAKFWFESKPTSRELLGAGFWGAKVGTKESKTVDAIMEVVADNPDLSGSSLTSEVKSIAEADAGVSIGIGFIRKVMNDLVAKGKLTVVDLGRDNAKGYIVS